MKHNAARLKAFSALVAQGAALLWHQELDEGSLEVTFQARLPFWKAWSDGSHLPKENVAGLGGLVTNNEGVAIVAFSESYEANREPIKNEKTGLNSRYGAMQSELMALQRTLDLALSAGAKKLEVKFDCQPLARLAADLLMQPRQSDAVLNEKHLKLKATMHQFERLALRWIPREANKFADALSKRPLNLGRFYGGKSQEIDLDEAWKNPEEGFLIDRGVNLELIALNRAKDRLNRIKERGNIERFSANGVIRLAVGAIKVKSIDHCWLGGASFAAPLLQKNAQLEPSENWGIEHGATLEEALLESVNKRLKEIKNKGDCTRVDLFISKAILSELDHQNAAERWIVNMESLVRKYFINNEMTLNVLEESKTISSKSGGHLTNEWELYRAHSLQNLQKECEEEPRVVAKIKKL